MTISKKRETVNSLEAAGTLFKRAASELYTAAQIAETKDQAAVDIYIDRAMQYVDKAQKLLNEL